MELHKHPHIRVSPEVQKMAAEDPAVDRQLRSLDHAHQVREEVLRALRSRSEEEQRRN